MSRFQIGKDTGREGTRHSGVDCAGQGHRCPDNEKRHVLPAFLLIHWPLKPNLNPIVTLLILGEFGLASRRSCTRLGFYRLWSCDSWIFCGWKQWVLRGNWNYFGKIDRNFRLCVSRQEVFEVWTKRIIVNNRDVSNLKLIKFSRNIFWCYRINYRRICFHSFND